MIGKDPSELSDRELLEHIASLDPNMYPLVPVAQQAIENWESDDD